MAQMYTPGTWWREQDKSDSSRSPLPQRHTVRCLFGACGIMAAITVITIYQARNRFPSWFAPLFLPGVVFFLGIIGFYLRAIHRSPASEVTGQGWEARWIWALSVLSVLCTSSLHQFAPFRLDMIAEWSNLPPFLKMIKFNLILTGTSLLAVILLMILFIRGHRRAAATGLLALAGMMLIPNDDCPNEFNRPWLRWIGASPMMFLGNSVALLIGYCGLHGIWPRFSVLIMGLIDGGVLLLGLGHLTRIVW